MSDFLNKIENFLFDILGLVLPGLIFLVVLILPSFFLNISTVPADVIDSSYILSGLITISNFLKNQWNLNASLTLASIFALSYLMGHVIKVFSIILYDFLEVLFDKTINKIVVLLFELIKTLLNTLTVIIWYRQIYESGLYKMLRTFFQPIKSTLIKIFVFKPSNYFSDNDTLRTESINKINSSLGTNFPDKWYSLYKLSSTIIAQENIKSLAQTFLAKYNLYRSLAFIFIFISLYFHFFFRTTVPFLSPDLIKISNIVLLSSTIFWFTFHYKYKRYWTLCGNETLVSLYYFLNKKKINET